MFRWKGEWILLELDVLGWNLFKWPCLQKISARTYKMWDSRKLEYVINCLLNTPLEFTPGHWSLDARRTSAQENFGRQLGMLACESSKAPTTLSRLLEVMTGFKHPRHLQVGLLFTWALAKKAEMKLSIHCRESLHTYFQQYWKVHQTYRRSALKLLSTLIWMISQSREQLQPIWGQIWAGLEKHILLEELLSKVTHKYPHMCLKLTSHLGIRR